MNRLTSRGRELVRLVHSSPGLSRAVSAKKLDMSTGSASDLVSSMSASQWLSEAVAPGTGGRGRPTKVIVAHPSGPLVLGAALRHEDWRVDAFQIGGRAVASVSGPHGGDPVSTLRNVEEACHSLQRRFDGRVKGVGLAVPGPVRERQTFTVTSLDWPTVKLRALWPQWETLSVGNDATLAGLAESRRGASQGASMSLHLLVEAGIGGGVIHRGTALVGHQGLAGEFGHMPLGDSDVDCPCGLRGCWGTSVDGGALARLLGDGEPESPVAYATAVLERARAGSVLDREAVEAIADNLGRGIGALVNALDPEVITVGGLAHEMLTFAPDVLRRSYELALMPVRRFPAPRLLHASLGLSGSVIGAAEQVWDDVFEAAVP